MEKLELQPYTLPVMHDCDVAVIGGGVGGVCAALAAARSGSKTIIVEREPFFGGVATGALMCSVTNYFTCTDGRVVTQGIPLEFIDRLVDSGGSMPHYARPQQPQIPNDPEIVKSVMAQMLKEAGVRCLQNTTLYDVLMNGRRLDALLCFEGQSKFAIKAKNIIDATGDLTVFKLCGAPYDECNEFGTYLFRMEGVDIDGIINWLEANPNSYDEKRDVPIPVQDAIDNWRRYGVFHLPHYSGKSMEAVATALENGELPERFGKHATELFAMGMFSCAVNKGVVLINSMAFRGNGHDLQWLSECEEEGRLAAKYIADFLVRRFPGFQNARICQTADGVGLRRSRKLKSRRDLLMDDIATGRKFEDTIGYTNEVDRRDAKGRRRFENPIEIPLSALVSDTVENVALGSGKNIGSDFYGLLRGQAGCMAIGQGVGAAAAIAVRDQFPLHDPQKHNMDAIQQELAQRHYAGRGK